MKKNSSLLLDKDDLLILHTRLVKLLGGLDYIVDALLLQQVHYWIGRSNGGIMHEGRKYVYNTYAEWGKQICGASESTIKRSVARLKDTKILIVKQLHGGGPMDKTNYYSIDYDLLEQLLERMEAEIAEISPADSTNSPVHTVITPLDEGRNDPMDTYSVTLSTITETTTETTTETNSPDETDQHPDPVYTALENLTGGLNSNTPKFVDTWREKHTDARILEAVEVARSKSARSVAYIDKILIGWEANGYPLTREEQIQAAKAKKHPINAVETPAIQAAMAYLEEVRARNGN